MDGKQFKYMENSYSTCELSIIQRDFILTL